MFIQKYLKIKHITWNVGQHLLTPLKQDWFGWMGNPAPFCVVSWNKAFARQCLEHIYSNVCNFPKQTIQHVSLHMLGWHLTQTTWSQAWGSLKTYLTLVTQYQAGHIVLVFMYSDFKTSTSEGSIAAAIQCKEMLLKAPNVHFNQYGAMFPSFPLVECGSYKLVAEFLKFHFNALKNTNKIQFISSVFGLQQKSQKQILQNLSKQNRTVCMGRYY